MVQLCQNTDLFFNSLKMVFQFILIQNLDGNLHRLVVFIVSKENFSESSWTKDFSVIIDNVVLFQFFSSLLFVWFQDIVLCIAFFTTFWLIGSHKIPKYYLFNKLKLNY